MTCTFIWEPILKELRGGGGSTGPQGMNFIFRLVRGQMDVWFQRNCNFLTEDFDPPLLIMVSFQSTPVFTYFFKCLLTHSYHVNYVSFHPLPLFNTNLCHNPLQIVYLHSFIQFWKFLLRQLANAVNVWLKTKCTRGRCS